MSDSHGDPFGQLSKAEEIEKLKRDLEIARAGRDVWVEKCEAAERERDEYRDSQRFWHEKASLLAQDVARAERLAEAAEALAKIVGHRLRSAAFPDEEAAEVLARLREVLGE